MAKKKHHLEPGFDLPLEVKNLPPELKGARLTHKQKLKDEKRRDRLMALHGSAARLSQEESDLAQAYIRVENYLREVERLTDLTEATIKERGRVPIADIRAELERAKLNLADAFRDCGELGAAHTVLSTLTNQRQREEQQEHVQRLAAAVSRPDDDHCCCPPETKHIERRLWVPERQQFVDFLSCPCGHLNATNTLPTEFSDLQRARAKHRKDERVKDTVVLKAAKHPSITG